MIHRVFTRQTSSAKKSISFLHWPPGKNSTAYKSLQRSKRQATGRNGLVPPDCTAISATLKTAVLSAVDGRIATTHGDVGLHANITPSHQLALPSSKGQKSSETICVSEFLDSTEIQRSKPYESKVSQILYPAAAYIFFNSEETKAWLGDVYEQRQLVNSYHPLVIEALDFMALVVDIWEKIIADLLPG